MTVDFLDPQQLERRTNTLFREAVPHTMYISKITGVPLIKVPGERIITDDPVTGDVTYSTEEVVFMVGGLFNEFIEIETGERPEKRIRFALLFCGNNPQDRGDLERLAAMTLGSDGKYGSKKSQYVVADDAGNMALIETSLTRGPLALALSAIMTAFNPSQPQWLDNCPKCREARGEND
ncbi:MAG: hypothetical protein JRN19_05450 [Nitrososphaerota archaeon]|nr:hypothetical protein [Nitrososphaerota archaeon]MDG7048927.1 hypothetical protein [Nitrososphaerota archaeon]MDG7051879.1 hypothetical protein [Nitrososphaerota archaeon]